VSRVVSTEPPSVFVFFVRLTLEISGNTKPSEGMTVAAFPGAQTMIAEKPFPCTIEYEPNCNRHD
jgi:hypothetical protein